MKKQKQAQSSNIKAQKLELNEAYRKCLYWFFAFPTREMSLNDLAISIGVSKTTAKVVISRLIEEGFLKKEELGKIWRISCDFEHYYNKTLKITTNLERIYLSGIIQETHKLIPNSRALILFGSYRKGDDNEKSDIDIAVEVLDNEELRIIPLGIISELGYRKNVQVNLYVFSRNKIDLNLFANISNGIVLDGFLEVRP
jgi:predicted nucleotidyltransferase